MRALAKLVATNNPDKILFVGEALVGNEAVDQLTKFDRALRDFSAASGGAYGAGSGSGKERGIDGMIVTKWDTVDDKVRRASVTHVKWCAHCTMVGRCGLVHDVRYWPAYYIRWLWSGTYTPSLRPLSPLTLLIDVH